MIISASQIQFDYSDYTSAFDDKKTNVHHESPQAVDTKMVTVERNGQSVTITIAEAKADL